MPLSKYNKGLGQETKSRGKPLLPERESVFSDQLESIQSTAFIAQKSREASLSSTVSFMIHDEVKLNGCFATENCHGIMNTVYGKKDSFINHTHTPTRGNVSVLTLQYLSSVIVPSSL